MNWDDIGMINLSIMASLGGFAGILAFIINFSSNIITERLSKKYPLKMNKEFEVCKNNLD